MSRDNFLIRPVQLKDLDDLFQLSEKVYLINLPRDKKLIQANIESSINSFAGSSQKKHEEFYIFCLVDNTKNKVVGTSMIHGKHGDETTPHFSLVIGKEEKFSTTINTGFTHGTLKLRLEFDGPTEIGGLVLDPEYRGNEYKLGKFLSFSRFLYIASNPGRFEDKLHCELMPPLDSESRSPLWEALGKKFMNMDYLEADRLSRKNKEFILSLFPQQNIYQTLLPLSARNAIGKVGQETIPVKHMLEKIGFEYINEVDPFDGGPHFQATTSEILPVKSFYKGELRPMGKGLDDHRQTWILSTNSIDGNQSMRLVECHYSNGVLLASEDVLSHFKDQKVVGIPLNY